MALRKTVQFLDSIQDVKTLHDAYVRVDSLNGGKTFIGAAVGFYKTSESKSPVKICGYWFEPKLDGKNFIAQAYEHIKTLPEFEGAIDC
jgi:hypothetical protein